VADIIAKHPNGIHARYVAELIGADEEKIDIILRCLSTRTYFYEGWSFLDLC
jgi:hypothetical protein